MQGTAYERVCDAHLQELDRQFAAFHTAAMVIRSDRIQQLHNEAVALVARRGTV